MDKVFAVRCPDYEQAGKKTTQLLAMMGGMGQFVAPAEKIVLKVNLLRAAKPELTANTPRSTTKTAFAVTAVTRCVRAKR
jgi:uncharacterized protein (DUF362 family)